MAGAVDLVRAYLHVNGYFTVTEYPVLEAGRGGPARMMTDLDILAFRFAGAGRGAPRTGQPGRGATLALQAPDPGLGRPQGSSDMIVGEIKEGRAELNRGARDPRVLAAALLRFGCCGPDEVKRTVQTLRRRGEADTGHGHRVRLVSFGSVVPASTPGYAAISFAHILAFLQDHLGSHWEVARHAQILDPALGFLSLLEKARRGGDT